MAKASDNDFPSILFSENAVKPSAPAAGHWRVYMKTDDKLYREDDGGVETEIGTGSGDVSYAQLLAMQLTNEIKGWPPVVKTGDLDALNLWFDKEGTPSTAPSVVDVSGEAGVTETYEQCIKVVADGANEGLSQRFTYADEPRVKSGRKLSTLWAIWCVGGVGATLSIINSSAEETAAAKVTAAAWTIVEVPNHTLAGTYCDIKIVADGAGTFYAVPLGANIGARGLPLPPRALRHINLNETNIVNAVDPGGADWTDADFTATTSNLACMVDLVALYKATAAAPCWLYVRRNGSAFASGASIVTTQASNVYSQGTMSMEVDDGQILEYKTGQAAGVAETVTIDVVGYWEWA